MKTFYEIKTIDLGDTGIKDFDMKSRTVTGYFSRFGNIDHDNDMLMPGAFKKSINERGSDGKNIIPHLADHKMDTNNLLSKPKLYEVADGGFFESTMTDTTKAQDILKQYRDGLINQHSFGFKTLAKNDKNAYREVKEVLLYEVSTVVLGVNDNTPFEGFKSLSKPQQIERYMLLKKCYDNGDYSDEFFQVIEAQIKQIEQEIIKAYTTEPVTTTQPEASNKDEFKRKLLLLNAKI